MFKSAFRSTGIRGDVVAQSKQERHVALRATGTYSALSEYTSYFLDRSLVFYT